MAVERRDRWFVLWFVIGWLFSLSLLAVLSIGLFILPVPVLAAIWLVSRRPSAMHGISGVAAGLSVPFFFLAFQNRGGPDFVCSRTKTGEACSELLNPWPWLVVGIVLAAAGCVWFARTRQAGARARPPALEQGVSDARRRDSDAP